MIDVAYLYCAKWDDLLRLARFVGAQVGRPKRDTVHARKRVVREVLQAMIAQPVPPKTGLRRH